MNMDIAVSDNETFTQSKSQAAAVTGTEFNFPAGKSPYVRAGIHRQSK